MDEDILYLLHLNRQKESSPSEVEILDMGHFIQKIFHTKIFHTENIRKTFFLLPFFVCLFLCLVTDENSESDSDTEEKLKGEKTSCGEGHRRGTGELPRWPFLLNVREGTEHPCRSS